MSDQGGRELVSNKRVFITENKRSNDICLCVFVIYEIYETSAEFTMFNTHRLRLSVLSLAGDKFTTYPANNDFLIWRENILCAFFTC